MATSDIKQHKDLIGIDLHIARLNAGTTSPIGVVTPSVIDEAYANKTTKELFIATGLTSNDWIKLSSDAAANLTGTGTPVGSKTPTSAGQLYGDLTTGDLYLSTGTTSNSWVLKAGGDETTESLKIDGTVTGNGTADDTTAIKNRLAVAITSSKKVLRAPAGTYKFSGRITPNGVRLIGSPGAKLLSTQGGPAQDITMAGSGSVLADWNIENLTISSSGQLINAASGAKNYKLLDLSIQTNAAAIQINNPGQENAVVQGVDISTIGYGFVTNESAKGKNVRVLFSNIYSRDSDAIELNNPQVGVSPELYDGLKQVFLFGNRLNADLYNGNVTSHSGFGMGVARVHEVIGIGNIVERARARGLHIEDSQENVLFLGNIFDGNLIDGIWLINQTGARPVIVTNNFIIKAKDALQQTGHGIYRIFDGRGTLQANLSNNYIKGFLNGLWIDGPSTAHIDGIIIEDCTVGVKTGGKLTGAVTMKNTPTLLVLGNGACIDRVKSLTPQTTTMEFYGIVGGGNTAIGGIGATLRGLESLTNSISTLANTNNYLNLFRLPTRFAAKVTAKIENVTGKAVYVTANVTWNGTTFAQDSIVYTQDGNITLVDVAAPFANNTGMLSLYVKTVSAQSIVVNYEFDGVYYLNTAMGPDIPPITATGLASSVSSTKATLTWNIVQGATSYIIKRSTVSGGSYTTVGTATIATYTDTGLTDNTTYYYVVVAVNGAGESADSTQVTATPLPPVGLPTVPSGLTATAISGSVSLAWAASTNGPIVYTVKRSQTSGGAYTNIATGVSSLGYNDTGLVNGTTYYYVVSATNVNGETANSTQVTATPSAENIIFYDNFNRADNSTDPGTSLGWKSNGTAATWGIVSGTLKQTSRTGTTNDYCLYTSPVSDGIVSSKFYHPANGQGLVFRRQDSANEWMVSIVSGVHVLRKRVINTITPVASLATAVDGDEISVRLEGSLIKAYVNGVEKGSTTDTFLQTAKDFGFYASSTNAVGEWDDFKIISLP